MPREAAPLPQTTCVGAGGFSGVLTASDMFKLSRPQGVLSEIPRRGGSNLA